MSEHVHHWKNVPGRPLACTGCGELWPGEPDWPPTTSATETGQEKPPVWSRRVNAMLEELETV